MFKIGDKVRIKDTSDHRYRGDGIIVDIEYTFYGFLRYIIRWGNNYKCLYDEKDIELIDDNEIVKIKWHKK